MTIRLAHLRLSQALDMDRHDFFRAQKLHNAADLFRLSGRQDLAEQCERAAERFFGDDSDLREMERE